MNMLELLFFKDKFQCKQKSLGDFSSFEDLIITSLYIIIFNLIDNHKDSTAKRNAWHLWFITASERADA